jgi:hypothetical protein
MQNKQRELKQALIGPTIKSRDVRALVGGLGTRHQPLKELSMLSEEVYG